MTQILDATCVNGSVTSESVVVSDADILSQGTRSSEGILVIQDDEAKYLTSNAEDLQDAIDKLSDILDQVSSLVASIVNDSVFIPGSGGASLTFPPSFSTDKAALDSAIDELNQMKDNLK